MPDDCEDCGESFQTLTKKRLHDCPGPTSVSLDGETIARERAIEATVDLCDDLFREIKSISASIFHSLETEGKLRKVFFTRDANDPTEAFALIRVYSYTSPHEGHGIAWVINVERNSEYSHRTDTLNRVYAGHYEGPQQVFDEYVSDGRLVELEQVDAVPERPSPGR